MKFSEQPTSTIKSNLNKENVDAIRNFYQKLLNNSKSETEMNYYLSKLQFFDNLSLAFFIVEDMESFLKDSSFKNQPE